MTKKQQIKLFEDKKVRVAWDDEREQWFFSVVDVVEVLTESKDPKDYLKKMRKREPELDAYVGTNCPLVAMTTRYFTRQGSRLPASGRRRTADRYYRRERRLSQ